MLNVFEIIIGDVDVDVVIFRFGNSMEECFVIFVLFIVFMVFSYKLCWCEVEGLGVFQDWGVFFGVDVFGVEIGVVGFQV